jgi:hypothetical protein
MKKGVGFNLDTEVLQFDKSKPPLAIASSVSKISQRSLWGNAANNNDDWDILGSDESDGDAPPSFDDFDDMVSHK